MSILIIDAKTVTTALPMSEAIEAMAVAFGKLSEGITLLMPAYAPTSHLGIKILSVYNSDLAPG